MKSYSGIFLNGQGFRALSSFIPWKHGFEQSRAGLANKIFGQRSLAMIPKVSRCDTLQAMHRDLHAHSIAYASTQSVSELPESLGQAVKDPSKWSETTREALSKCKGDKNFYAIFEINGVRYFGGEGDIVMVNRLNTTSIGDVINLTRVKELGGTNFVITGNPFVYPSYFTLEAIVIEHPVSSDIIAPIYRGKKRTKYTSNNTHHTAIRIKRVSIQDLNTN